MVEATDSQTNRGLRAALPTSYATYVDRWAIVVGVSKYQDGSINLKYADRDAEALYELLKTPSGGGFAEEHICKLVNEEATTANITRALRSFLKKPGKDDIVLLYFACHGAPDTDRPDILYLLTHDTDPKDIAGTALPMREINLSLKENLLAERVIIIADTCHSAGISKGGTRDAGDNSGAINLYLQEVGATQKGIALLTSAEANQVSFEDEKWGSGHGVFTHFLLEGMQGAADRNPKNGIVTVGELFEYVRENVKRATGDRQHPCIGPDSFDRNLPIAITAGISAQEHYELGCQLYQIALKLDDKYCFESASRHLKEAIRQAEIVGRKLPEAQLKLGLALTASGDLPEAAVTAFKKAIKVGVTDADYYLGIAYLNQGEVEVAREHLQAFLSKQPDSDKAGAVQELISWFDASNSSHSEAVNRHALLIGINYTDNPKMPSLKGPVNDIEILNEVLSQKYNFKIKMLSDMEATHENIINAFYELQELTSPEDVLIIYYSGCGFDDRWITADTELNDAGEEQLKFIDSNELYSLIYAIPALNKYLIIDSEFGEAFRSFIERVQQTKLCSLFLSASIGQGIPEVNIENTQKTHGYFTYTLVQELQKASQNILIRDLFERVKESVQSRFTDQTPFFLGAIDKPLFFADSCLDLFTFSQRRCYSAFDDCSLETLHQRATKIFTSVFPDFYYSLGLAFLGKSNNSQALASLKTAAEHAKHNVEEKLVDLGVAQFNNQLYADALQTFQKRSEISTSDTASDLLSNIISATDSLTKSKRCALLVGIDTYLNADSLVNGTSVDDTLALRNILTEKCGFQSEDIRILLNEEATHKNILTAFQELIAESQENSTLFYFAGRGSNDKQDSPTILAFDSRSQSIQDIQLAELASLTTYKEISLLSIIDSDWTYSGNNNRYTTPDETIYSSSRKMIPLFDDRDREDSKIPRIGSTSIYRGLIRYQAKHHGDRDGRLTSELIQFLRTNSLVIATHQKLLHFFGSIHQESESEGENVYFSSNGKDVLQQILFSNYVFESKVRASLTKVEQEPTRHAVLILRRLIEQRNGAAPEELFNLGIAHYRLNEYDKSISALQTAIDQISGQNNTTTGEQPTPQRSYPEAHYWLGRVLYESKRDPARAVSELRLATQQSPDNSAAHYYLGKALQSLVEQEILTEAERAFQTYLNAGAPLGQQEEVQAFVKSRKADKKAQIR